MTAAAAAGGAGRHRTDVLSSTGQARCGAAPGSRRVAGAQCCATAQLACCRSQQGIYLVTLVLSAVSAALLIGPVGYHRTVFRQRLRPQLVKTGHWYAIAGLVLLLLALVGPVQLAASFVLGGWASILAAALAGLFATLWFAIPLAHRLRYQHRPEGQDADLPVAG
jgi:hypothetical protein